MSEIKQDEGEHEGLLKNASQKRRFPQVFRWKVATIIISVLIAIFLVVDIILYVHYNNSQPRRINYTFLTDLISHPSTSTIKTQELMNIIGALSLSYSDLWFQSSSLIQSWNTLPLTLPIAGSFFDGDASDNQLFIFTLSDGVSSYTGAAFSHIGFPLPNSWQDYLADLSHSYYTFEIDDRQSALFGGNSQKFLKMSGNSDNLLNCEVIKLKETSISFLEMFSLDFSDPTKLKATLGAPDQNTICFEGQPLSADALKTLQSLLNVPVATTTLDVTKILVFHLSA